MNGAYAPGAGIRRVPYALPAKRPRVKSGIARAPQRIWPRHRRFVKSHGCCVPGCPALLVDPAHLRSVVNDGTGLKPFDWFLVPLCRHHHCEEEACGPDTFGDRHAIDLWAIAAELVRRSPDTRMRLIWRDWQAQQDEIQRPAAAVSPPAGPHQPRDPGRRIDRGNPLTVALLPLCGTVG